MLKLEHHYAFKSNQFAWVKILAHKCRKYDTTSRQGYDLITRGSNFKYSHFFYGYLILLKIPPQVLR